MDNYQIKIADRMALFYNAGEWNIKIEKDNDLDHHKVKKETRTVVENHGDLNRCIAAVPSYSGLYDIQTYNSLRSAYVSAIKRFVPMKSIPFEDKYHVQFDSCVDNREYHVATNKKHHGIKLNYQYSTEHHLSGSGVTQEERTFANFYQAALRIMDIEVGEFVKRNKDVSVYSVIDFMNNMSATLHQQIETRIKVTQ